MTAGGGSLVSDEDLLARSRADPAAFEPLVGRLGPAVHAYLARRAPGAADDLLADVWVAAFGARHAFDPARGGVRGWLFGIARNVLLTHLRRDRHRRQAAGSAEEEFDWAAVDERLDARAVRPALRAALAGLPAVERELLLLVAWEGLAPGEAAAVLEIPAGTARSRLHRARDRMRERLAAARQVRDDGGSVAEGRPS